MSRSVKIHGTKMQLAYDDLESETTGGEIKHILLDQFRIPLGKLSLFHLSGAPFPDHRPISDLGHRATVEVRLQVEVLPEVPITVNLVATQQYPLWRLSFPCFETTTVEELKAMLAERLGWHDGNLGELDLMDRVDPWGMEDDGRITADYLVTDGSDVEVCFLYRILANGFPNDYTEDEGETGGEEDRDEGESASEEDRESSEED